MHAHDELHGRTEMVVGRIRDEGVERPAEAGLSDELERGTTHPVEHVNLLLAVLDAYTDRFLELAGDVVEDGQHVPHVRDGEHGVQQPALLAVTLAERGEETVTQHAVHRAEW